MTTDAQFAELFGQQVEMQDPRQALWGLRKSADQFDVYGLADHALSDPEFEKASGSATPDKHHHGAGGLVVHTFEVFRIGAAMMRELAGIGRDDYRDLYLAALFHDYGKTLDYTYNVEDKKWQRTPHCRRIHHIPRSAVFWHTTASKFLSQGGKYNFVTPDYIDYIMHAILSHHGCREWGSPVSPDTPLAWVLHLADMTSARTNELLPQSFPRFRSEI